MLGAAGVGLVERCNEKGSSSLLALYGDSQFC